MDEEAREAYFDNEQVIILNSWVESQRNGHVNGGTTQTGNHFGGTSG